MGERRPLIRAVNAIKGNPWGNKTLQVEIQLALLDIVLGPEYWHFPHYFNKYLYHHLRWYCMTYFWKKISFLVHVILMSLKVFPGVRNNVLSHRPTTVWSIRNTKSTFTLSTVHGKLIKKWMEKAKHKHKSYCKLSLLFTVLDENRTSGNKLKCFNPISKVRTQDTSIIISK